MKKLNTNDGEKVVFTINPEDTGKFYKEYGWITPIAQTIVNAGYINVMEGVGRIYADKRVLFFWRQRLTFIIPLGTVHSEYVWRITKQKKPIQITLTKIKYLQ